jgi:LuxR family maltose regulon positive regulatory protein
VSLTTEGNPGAPGHAECAGPRSLQLLHRNRLIAALDRAATVKVTLISAPAGSGKTSLLRTWATVAGQRRLATVGVRRDEQDAQHFWLSVLNTVRHASGPVGDAVVASPTPQFNGPAMVDAVQAELAGNPGEITLVVDDLQELRSPEALAALACLLATLPANAHAVLATRRDLPLRLHQLRLAGDLAEIRAADLRFTEAETRELLAASGIRLSGAAAARLHQRTEGWAAGLRLAALSLAGHPDPERFVEEFSGTHRAVAEYLLAEMLDHQPAEVRHLLLRTCLLDGVHGELADVLTGRHDSARLLLELEDANAFVVSVDPGRTWFRYHQLFTDLLRLELRRTLPAEAPALHRAAAEWLARQGHVAEAIRHTQAAGDWSDAARLLADHSISLTMDGLGETVEALLRAFPRGAHAENPELALVRAGRSLAHGRLDEAHTHLTLAEAHAGTTPPDRRYGLRVATRSLRLALAVRRGDLAGVLAHATSDASPTPGDIALDNDLRALALLNLGTVEASLALPDAERHLREATALAHEIGRPYLAAAALARLGFAARIHPFAVTRQRCREAIEFAERHGWGAEPIVAPALVTLASTLVWTGELDEAERWLLRTARAVETDTGPDVRLLVHIVSGMLHCCRGRHGDALRELTSATRLQAHLPDPHAVANQVTDWTVATQVRAGLLDEAHATLAGLDDERAEIRNAQAAILLAEHDPGAALAALRDVLDGTAPAIGYVTVVEAQLLAGRAHRRLGDRRAATAAAERALTLAGADRLVLPFAMTGATELLESLPRRDTEYEPLRTEILDVLRGSSVLSVKPPSDQLVSGYLEKLSPGELRVMRYLPTNLSRPEIATELSISLNTVSTHIRSIYAKLGVGDRSSAVRRAQELQIPGAGRTR